MAKKEDKNSNFKGELINYFWNAGEAESPKRKEKKSHWNKRDYAEIEKADKSKGKKKQSTDKTKLIKKLKCKKKNCDRLLWRCLTEICYNIRNKRYYKKSEVLRTTLERLQQKYIKNTLKQKVLHCSR